MSEHDRLGKDAGYFADLARSEPEILGSTIHQSDPYQACYRLTITDLFWQVQQYAGAVHSLIQEHLHLPLLGAQRGMFESATAMSYLRAHPNRAFEATVLLAFSYIKDCEEHALQPLLVEERKTLLTRMPQDAVATARNRTARKPKTWSGLRMREFTERSGMKGYDTFYAPLSGSVHAARAGRYFTVSADGDQVTLRTGWEIGLEEREVQSNFARRLLHGSFKIMWDANGGKGLAFNSTNPDEWKWELEAGA